MVSFSSGGLFTQSAIPLSPKVSSGCKTQRFRSIRCSGKQSEPAAHRSEVTKRIINGTRRLENEARCEGNMHSCRFSRIYFQICRNQNENVCFAHSFMSFSRLHKGERSETLLAFSEQLWMQLEQRVLKAFSIIGIKESIALRTPFDTQKRPVAQTALRKYNSPH